MHMTDVIDASILEQLNSSLNEAFGVQVILLDVEGAPIIDYSGSKQRESENVLVAAMAGRHHTVDDREVAEFACESAMPLPPDCASDALCFGAVPIHVGGRQIGSWYLKRIRSGNGNGNGSEVYGQDTQTEGRESSGHESAIALVSVTMRLMTETASRNVRSVERVRQHVELALNARRQHLALERIVDNSPVGLVEVDREGRILWGNQQAQTLLGFHMSGAFWSGTQTTDYTLAGIDEAGSGGGYSSVARRLLRGEVVTDIRCVLCRADGTSVELRVDAAPTLSANGRLDRVSYALHEVLRSKSEPGASEPSSGEVLPVSGVMSDQSIAKRVEIAADLERSVTSLLQSAWIELDSLRREESTTGEPVVADRLDTVACLLHEAAGNAATVSSRCWPLLFDDLGIGATIERRLRDLEEYTGLSWSFEERNDEAHVLERSRRAVLYQVAEELLTAVATDARRTKVVLTANQYYWLLTISVHVDESAPSPFGGVLVVLAREQLRRLGGSIETVRGDDGAIDQCVIVPSTQPDPTRLPMLESCGCSH